jgi:hypothetical protein
MGWDRLRFARPPGPARGRLEPRQRPLHALANACLIALTVCGHATPSAFSAFATDFVVGWRGRNDSEFLGRSELGAQTNKSTPAGSILQRFPGSP